MLDVSLVEDRPKTLKVDGKEIDPKTGCPLVLINPEIELRGATETGVEGCLGFPECTGDIERATSVIVRAQTLESSTIEIRRSRPDFFRARFNTKAIISMESYSLIGIENSTTKARIVETALETNFRRKRDGTQRGATSKSLVSETTLSATSRRRFALGDC